MSESPRILVILDRSETSAAVLRSVGSFTSAGLMPVRGCIAAGVPVIDEEMFTNAWFDERAEQLLGLLTSWREQGISFELRETTAGGDVGDTDPLDLGVLRNIIEAAQQDCEHC